MPVEINSRILTELNAFYGVNAGYAMELFERYQQNPDSVDAETRRFFDSLVGVESNPPATPVSKVERVTTPAPATSTNTVLDDLSHVQVSHVVAAVRLAHAIRERGHLGARLDPLGSPPLGDPALQTGNFGIDDDDLAKLPSSVIGGHAASFARNALEAVYRLREMYSGTISYEFDQVKSPEERRWLRDAVGLNLFREPLLPNTARARLRRLTQVEVFEKFLHQAFPGQKRFSLEGNDALVLMLDEIVNKALASDTREIIIGMAHRGRLNVLAHVLGKPYPAIISEFGHSTDPDSEALVLESQIVGLSGDVKYHLGAELVVDKGSGRKLMITLAPNPSHLEFVNPVIQGMARASQEQRQKPGAPVQDVEHSIPVVIHGDAAFPAEGIVAETMNLWNLRGYRVGGVIHILVNNQIGFTTDPGDGRSTHFASDLAKGFEIPIIHVNADDPDAAMVAVRMANAYRARFNKDVFVDLVGYRRWGHNEGDEPAYTQPRMYEIIRSHPTVREIYARHLEQNGIVSRDEADRMVKEAFQTLETAKKHAEEEGSPLATGLQGEAEEIFPVELAVPPVNPEQLKAYNEALLNWPTDFEPNPKLARLLQRRASTVGPEGGIDWGQAEALAFASILADGTAVRVTGQDSERGTFSHRHAVLHDHRNQTTYTPLQNLPQAKASFSIFNSPISEAAVMGFEYGYSVRADDSLDLWEAQFGDFANVAQVIIDQFIASGRAKWRQNSPLVLLLPHGYEGQGPEHSSARVERYLELCAAENWRVVICSNAAQYYHLLRLQAFLLKQNPRPLVVFTPKSLLRHPAASASLEELANGFFQTVIDDEQARNRPEKVRRVALCSGKVAIDLLTHAGRGQAEDLSIVRVEQLYPFPAEELGKVLAGYPNLKQVLWVQEEPLNMGAWRFVAPQLAAYKFEVRAVGRPENSSPATGFHDRYQAEQEHVLAEALKLPVNEFGGLNVR